jgi:hypothetical protein
MPVVSDIIPDVSGADILFIVVSVLFVVELLLHEAAPKRIQAAAIVRC